MARSALLVLVGTVLLAASLSGQGQGRGLQRRGPVGAAVAPKRQIDVMAGHVVERAARDTIAGRLAHRHRLASVWAAASTVARRSPSCHDNCTHPASWYRVTHACRVRSPASGCARLAVRTQAWRAVIKAWSWASVSWRRRCALRRTASLRRSTRRTEPCGTSWTCGVNHSGRKTPCRRSLRIWGVVRAVMSVEPAAASAGFPVRLTIPRSP